MVNIILANGFETIEAYAVIDILKRAKIDCETIGIDDDIRITSAQGITVIADSTLSELEDFDVVNCEMLYLPGGPGYKELKNNERVLSILKKAYNQKKLIAAICAAPIVLGKSGILENKIVSMYPGMENEMPKTTTISNKNITVDGNILTSKGPGTAIEFGLFLVSKLKTQDVADKIKKEMLI